MDRVRDLEAKIAQASSATECRDALLELATLHAAEFRNREGLRAARNALNISRSHDDAIGVGRALAAATVCHYQRGDYASAVASGLDAIDAYASEDPAGRSAALRSIALALSSVGVHELAEAAARRSVEDAMQAWNADREAQARAVLAIILAERGAFSDARDELRRASKLNRQLGEAMRLKKTVSNVGHTYRRQGNESATAGSLPRARYLWRQALRVYRVALGVAHGEAAADDAIIYGSMAECECRLGNLDAAEAAVSEALGQRVESPVILAPCHLWESQILMARGRLRAAERACERACAVAGQIENGAILVDCLEAQAHLNDLQGRFEKATDLELKAREAARERAKQLARVRAELSPLWERCTAAPLAATSSPRHAA